MGKPSLHEDRREEETRDTEAQRRDVRCIEAGRNRQPRDNAPTRPDRYGSKAERGPFQIGNYILYSLGGLFFAGAYFNRRIIGSLTVQRMPIFDANK